MHTHSSLQSPRFQHRGHPRAHAAPGASATGTTTRRSLEVPRACCPARRQKQAVHHQVQQSLQILTNLLQRGLAARKAGHLPLARATTRRRRMHRERERSRGTRFAGAACGRNLEKADAVLLDYFLKSRVPSARSAPSAAGSSCSSKQRQWAARRHGSARPPKGPHEQFDLLGRPQSPTVLVERTVPPREARCEQGSFGEVNAGSRTHRGRIAVGPKRIQQRHLTSAGGSATPLMRRTCRFRAFFIGHRVLFSTTMLSAVFDLWRDDDDDDYDYELNINPPTPCFGKRPQRPKPKGPGRPWGQKPLAHGRTVEGVVFDSWQALAACYWHGVGGVADTPGRRSLFSP